MHVVTGFGLEVGVPMTTDPRVDMISFTGSTAVGRAAMAAASATLKKISMELGGKNPQIVFADADLEAAIDACVFGAYSNAGECCNAGSRILLHRDIVEEFVASLVEKSSAVRVGDPLDPETNVGAIISADHLVKIERYVAAARDAGATVRTGGERLASDGFFMAPTVVDQIDPSMPIASDEVFGPVVTVMTFD
jgi:betaine-aldehyde dehydrogenase